MDNSVKIKDRNPMEDLIADSKLQNFPRVGEFIKGIIISIGKNEVIIDIPGLTCGIVRGWELEDESGQMTNIKVGDEVSASVLDLENERGMIELSFRVAGHQKAWDKLKSLQDSGEIVTVKASEANKGGLIVELGRVLGFLPVSQLNSEHYPRVEGGNKAKILEKLKEYIGQEFTVKVIDTDENEEKLIVSEKAIDEGKHLEAISGYNIEDELEVKISGIVDFGLFVELPTKSAEASESKDDTQKTIEGLIHISEISWQRVDDPRDLFKIGDSIKAKIIDISRAKVSLSIKRLLPDPWQEVDQHYKVDQIIKGKVVKLNEFGAFVELDHNIHGLAHVSGLNNSNEAPLVVDQAYDFKIINIEAGAHKLGLSRDLSAAPPKDPSKEESEK